MANNFGHLEQKAEKEYKRKERRKRKRMPVTGKQVFTLQRLLEEKAGQHIQSIKKKKK